jgi:hypothetical protein
MEPPKQLIDIDIFRSEALPRPLQEEADRQQLTLEPRTLVAVKTSFVPATPIAFAFFEIEFMPIGRTPDDCAAFMRKLAAEDGIDLSKVFEDKEDSEEI